MDVHIYEKGKYLRTMRNVKPGTVVDYEQDEKLEFYSVPDATGDSTDPLPNHQYWPNAEGESGAEL